MKFIKNLLVGSGMSSLIYFKTTKKKLKIFSNSNSQILKSKNFYEYDGIGGNSNIWGGYINFKRHKKFLQNKKYQKFFLNNIFKVKKIFKSTSKFSNTYCLMDNTNKIFRINKKFFKNDLIKKKIKKIFIKKNFIELFYDDKKLSVATLSLCIGNLNLIKLLYNSNWINLNDTISFNDSKCNYVLNLFIDQKKNYYIPMPIGKILEKIFFKKSKTYKTISETIILQKFSGIVKNYKISCEDLLKMKKSNIRFFLSNHVSNLKINNIPIRKFIYQRSKKINVFCSGTVKKYLPGPIIQDLIFDITNNQ